MGDITPEENWLIRLKNAAENTFSSAMAVVDKTMADIRPEIASAERAVEHLKQEGGLNPESDREKRNKHDAAQVALVSHTMSKELMSMDFSNPNSIGALENRLANDEYWQFLQNNPEERERLAAHVTGGLLDGIESGDISHADIDKIQGRSKALIGGQAAIDALHAFKDGRITREQADAITQESRRKMESTPQQVTSIEIDTSKDAADNRRDIDAKRADSSRSARQDLTSNEELADITAEKTTKHKNLDKDSDDLLAAALGDNGGKEIAKTMKNADIQDQGKKTEIAVNNAPTADETLQSTARGGSSPA